MTLTEVAKKTLNEDKENLQDRVQSTYYLYANDGEREPIKVEYYTHGKYQYSLLVGNEYVPFANVSKKKMTKYDYDFEILFPSEMIPDAIFKAKEKLTRYVFSKLDKVINNKKERFNQITLDDAKMNIAIIEAIDKFLLQYIALKTRQAHL